MKANTLGLNCDAARHSREFNGWMELEERGGDEGEIWGDREDEMNLQKIAAGVKPLNYSTNNLNLKIVPLIPNYKRTPPGQILQLYTEDLEPGRSNFRRRTRKE
jgi:hypothetical protein